LVVIYLYIKRLRRSRANIGANIGMIFFQKEPVIKRFVKVDIFFQNPNITKVEI